MSSGHHQKHTWVVVEDRSDIFFPHWFLPELVGEAGSIASAPFPAVGRGGKISS